MRRRSRWDRVFLVILLGGGVLLTLAHRLNADEGQILTGAWNLFNGRRIYRDFFEFIGPGSFAWVSVFFRVLGPSYAAAIVASQVLLLIGTYAFDGTARMVIGHVGVARATSLIWLLCATTPPFINHNSYGTYLAVVFTLFMFRVFLEKRKVDAFTAGALSALTFFILQPKGVILFLVGLAALSAKVEGGRRTLGGTSALRRSGDQGLDAPGRRSSAVHILLPYLMGALVVGALGFLLWGLNPLLALTTVGRGVFKMDHIALSYGPLMGFLGMGILVAWVSAREGLMDWPGRFLLLLQGGLWVASAYLPDLWHLWINSFPLLLMLGRLGGRAFSRELPQPWRRSIVVLFAVVFAAGVGRAIARNTSNTRLARHWISNLGGILKGENFFQFTFLPSFYLEFGVPDPYYNSVLYVGAIPPEQFRRDVVTLAKEQPRYVILDYSSVAKYGHTLANPVDRFIRLHYSRVRTIDHSAGALEIWERTPGTS